MATNRRKEAENISESLRKRVAQADKIWKRFQNQVDFGSTNPQRDCAKIEFQHYLYPGVVNPTKMHVGV